MVKRIVPTTINLLLLIGVILFIPPKNAYYISLFIFVAFLFWLSFFKIFLSRKDSFLVTILVVSFLIINYLVGFSLLNTILLICLFITVKVLLK
jgi:hypothetical protein